MGLPTRGATGGVGRDAKGGYGGETAQPPPADHQPPLYVEEHRRMTPTRLREILDELLWSQRDLATLADCNERLARRWAAGQAPIPAPIADWLERRLVMHRSAPVPEWRSRAA